VLYENDDRIKQNEINKTNSINNATNIYDKLIHNNEEITKQNEKYLDQYYNTNVDLANRTTDYNIDLINQQQKQAEKTYQNNMKTINSDYQKSINPYGVDAEVMASNGLNNSGYAEYTNINKFAKTQEKLASTRANNEQAYQEFENKKSQARLENDSTIAQYGLDVLKQRLEAQLKEFQYNSDLTLGKLSTTQQLENDYYSRYMDIVNQINFEKEQEEQKRQFDKNLSYQKSQDKISNALAEKYYQLSKKYK
jgi:hypothetical protein